jgi:hypothetical protein
MTMNFGTTDAAMLTGTVVIVGRWTEGNKLDIKIIIGSVIMAIGLAVVSQINAGLGTAFGVLILVTALLRYIEPIFKKMGFAK